MMSAVERLEMLLALIAAPMVFVLALVARDGIGMGYAAGVFVAVLALYWHRR